MAKVNFEQEDSLISYYESCGSVRETAARFDYSPQKVRKILIDAGRYASPRSILINQMYDAGKTREEIADCLGVTKKTVDGYLPYSKCVYNAPNPSRNALRIRKCRQK